MIDDGGQAFPTKEPSGHGFLSYRSGMSLRDYFAIRALPLTISSDPECRAIQAYRLADAMLVIRIKQGEPNASN